MKPLTLLGVTQTHFHEGDPQGLSEIMACTQGQFSDKLPRYRLAAYQKTGRGVQAIIYHIYHGVMGFSDIRADIQRQGLS